MTLRRESLAARSQCSLGQVSLRRLACSLILPLRSDIIRHARGLFSTCWPALVFLLCKHGYMTHSSISARLGHRFAVSRAFYKRRFMTQSSTSACLGHNLAVSRLSSTRKCMTQNCTSACLGHKLAVSRLSSTRKCMTQNITYARLGHKLAILHGEQ